MLFMTNCCGCTAPPPKFDIFAENILNGFSISALCDAKVVLM